MELTGIGQILRGFGDLYILIALAAIVIALYRPQGWKPKAITTAIVVIVFGFIPAKNWMEKSQKDAFAREAWAYFKKLCDEKSGEKIYKPQVGIKSVFVLKPLPPATDNDNYDQFWYGDPYSASATSMRVENAAGTLVYPIAPTSSDHHGKGLDFVEAISPIDKSGEKKLVRYYFEPAARDYKKVPIDHAVSRFGVSWEDISTPVDRKFWVAGSRLSIVELSDKSLVAERIGYFIESGFGSTAGQRRPWLTSRGPNTTCPSIRSSDYEDRIFILKALNP